MLKPEEMPSQRDPMVLGTVPATWQSVALRLGEELAAVGPEGYYAMTPREWLTWALQQLDKV
jgi:hypothetical protein